MNCNFNTKYCSVEEKGIILQSSLKNGSKIERNEELIAYQTIKDELNISKK